jgi:hypothetical protein
MSLSFSYNSDFPSDRPLTGRSSDDHYDEEENEKPSTQRRSSNGAIDSNSQSSHRLTKPSTSSDSSLSSVSPVDRELEALFQKCHSTQNAIKSQRQANIEELENLKATMKKIKRETEELLKAQQNNLASMGRK